MKLEAVKKYNCTADYWSFTAETFVTPSGEKPLGTWYTSLSSLSGLNTVLVSPASGSVFADDRKFYHNWNNYVGTAVSVAYDQSGNNYSTVQENQIYYAGNFNFNVAGSDLGRTMSLYNTREDAINDTNRITLTRVGSNAAARIYVYRWKTELQVSREHYFSKKIAISLGSDRTDRMTIFAKEPLPLFSELRNIRDAAKNIVLKDGIWRIKSASPVLNAFNKTEGYRMTAELYSGLGYEWSQQGRQIFGSDASQYIDFRE
jgi:hypothetical protein